jgi:hypothetical protein
MRQRLLNCAIMRTRDLLFIIIMGFPYSIIASRYYGVRGISNNDPKEELAHCERLYRLVVTGTWANVTALCT